MDKMILYEDDALLVVHKPAGIATESARIGQADIVSQLRNERKRKGQDTYIGVVHRLDQPVEGLLVFAKDAATAKALSLALQNGKVTKCYAALVAGIPSENSGVCSDYLWKDSRTNLSRIVAKETKGAKKAELRWQLCQAFPQKGFSLVEVELFTGRHHQIRVQMAAAGMPLLGDRKYGTSSANALAECMGLEYTALIADKLSLVHPRTGEILNFCIDFPQKWNICSKIEKVKII